MCMRASCLICRCPDDMKNGRSNCHAHARETYGGCITAMLHAES